MKLGERIKTIRKFNGLTQNELAKLANISRSYLADVERNRYNPSLDTLKSLADALGASMDRLTGASVSSIIDDTLREQKMSLESICNLAKVPTYFISNLDNVIPDEKDYEHVTKIAKVLGIPPSKLRTALARQEPPVYDGLQGTADEDFDVIEEDMTTAAHRADDSTSNLPEAAQQSIKAFIAEMHKIYGKKE